MEGKREVYARVTRGIETCISKGGKCGECPYHDYGEECDTRMLQEALTLIRDQQRVPRVASRGEYLNGAGVGCCEYRDEDGSTWTEACSWYCGGAIAEFRSTICCDAAEYGKTWRMWYGEPTIEQRKRAVWQ